MARQAPSRARNVRAGLQVVPFLVLSLLSGLGLALLYLAAVRTELGQRVDESAFGSLDADRNPSVFEATDDLLRTIDVSSVALLGVGIAILAVFRGRIASAVAAGVLVLGANVTTQILKARLDRPDLITDGVVQSGSFPSGHVTVAMSLALALILVASPTTRPIAAAVGGAYAAAVGVGVLLLNWHRPSDVLGAYLVCGVWFGVAAAISTTTDRRRAITASGAGPWGVAFAGATSAVFASIAAWAVWRRFDVLTVVSDRAEFVVAAVVVTLAAGALVAVATVLLHDATRASRGHRGVRSGERQPRPAGRAGRGSRRAPNPSASAR